MKNRIIFFGLFMLFLIEFAVLALYAFPEEEKSQDMVAINEVIQTIQGDWDSFEEHVNGTVLEYAVLDANGIVRYKTGAGLSENVNAAIRHKDTVLELEVEGSTVGKLILYNNDADYFRSEKRKVIFVILMAIVFQGCICAGYLFYIQHTIIKPFQKMRHFAERIAGGYLDIPLEMDRQNLFGSFTESFDIMRSELKKARIAEAKANADKKELVAKLSHDIKTPVASIKAASEVGAALSTDEKNRENYEQIIRKTDQINTLVTNLFSATLEELQELSVMPADLCSREVCVLLENADYLHRASLPAVPECMVYADRLRLQQVFDNIFANSYKYAGTQIDVVVRMEGKYLLVSIEDYGGGVDEEELPLLKEKFRRGSNTKDIEGAGLGLYISDYCMKKMQGRLAVENGRTGLKVTIWIAFSNTI